jgi:branched-chain amino acid transport system permease protein/neutral amino acid transport system permease protein
MSSLGFGLVSAAVLAIAAVGFTMQFAVANVLNLAYGSVMINSAFVAFYLNVHANMNPWIAMLGGIATGAVGSYLLNRFIYTPFQRRNPMSITVIMAALGMDIAITFGLQAIVGGGFFSYRQSTGTLYRFLGMDINLLQLIIMAISAAVMILTTWLLKFTRLGKAMRATSSNPNLARNSGVRTSHVITTTWLISGALCGLAGTVFAMQTGVFEATSAQLYIVIILAAMFLGGPGKPYGAMLGALIIGTSTELSATVFNPQYKMVVAYILLLAILTFRPNGLFGSEMSS